MKKYIPLLIFVNLVVAILFCSCDEDKKYEDIPVNKIYIVNSGYNPITLYATEEMETYELGAHRAGMGNQAVDAKMRLLTLEELTEYNIENKTDYVYMPEYIYQMNSMDLSISSGDASPSSSIDIDFKTLELQKLQTLLPNVDYVLPVKIELASIEINEAKSVSIIKPEVKSPLVYLGTIGQVIHTYASDKKPNIDLEIDLKVDFKNRWDIVAEIVTPQKLIDEYNLKHETYFNMIPQEGYALPQQVSLVAGVQSATINVKVDGDKLTYGHYMLPIELSSTSIFAPDTKKNIYLIGLILQAPLIAKDKWKIVDFSSEEPLEGAPNGLAAAIIDGDLNTFWHQQWSVGAPVPHHITIDMNEEKTISEFGIARRPWNNHINEFEIHMSSDNVSWARIGQYQMPTEAPTPEEGLLVYGAAPTKGRYVKIVILSSRSFANATIAEFEAYGY